MSQAAEDSAKLQTEVGVPGTNGFSTTEPAPTCSNDANQSNQSGQTGGGQVGLPSSPKGRNSPSGSQSSKMSDSSRLCDVPCIGSTVSGTSASDGHAANQTSGSASSEPSSRSPSVMLTTPGRVFAKKEVEKSSSSSASGGQVSVGQTGPVSRTLPPPKPIPPKKPVNLNYRNFCLCPKDWLFSDLRQMILDSQQRSCPRCHTKFKNIIIIEKTITPCEMLLSCQGLLVIVTNLIQYSILFYGAFLALVDVNLAESDNLLGEGSRWTLYLLSIGFVIIALYNMCNSIYKTARLLCHTNEDKQIIDVLNDLCTK